MKENGKIKVANKGLVIGENNKIKESIGKAWIPKEEYPARLKVSFFFPFAGNYYIIELDKDYKYALVGDPSRKYLWILARENNLDQVIYQQLIYKAAELGFDTQKIELTKHKK